MVEVTHNPFEFSIVVTGEHCNPSILNQDFLKIEGIIPEEWQWELQGPPIMTPPLSNVSYSSGISILVEPGRVMVVDKQFRGELGQSKTSDIIAKYIETLPKVRYTGVGINYKTLIDMPDPVAVLKERFLQDKCCGDQTDTVTTISIKLGFPQASGVLNLSCENAEQTRKVGNSMIATKGILVAGNFHRDCSGYPTTDQVQDHISHWQKDYTEFTSTLSEIFKSENNGDSKNGKE
jgi:hypothetical protein